LRQPGRAQRPITFHAAAERLNDRNIESCTGAGRWTGYQLRNMADRLGINHPHRMPHAARSAVREIWEHCPETSGREILEVLRRDHIISVGRIYELLRECRGVTARQDPVQKRVGWRIDYRTSARGRIGLIWKRRPEVTARQVIEKLGARCPVNTRFVQRVLKQCWVAYGKRSKQQLYVGRRALGSWRGRPNH